MLVGLAGTTQAAGFDNMMNPLNAFNPAAMNNPFAPNPFSSGPFGSNPFAPSPFGLGNPFGSPLGGFGSPLGFGSPFGLGSPLGLGALAAPLGLGLLNPLGGGMGNAMYPAMQVAPNMMSYQHMNQMGSPYGGGPFAGNPYLQRGMPNPFSAPAFSPSMPTLPSMPFAVPQQQGGMAGFVPMPQQQMPYGMMYSAPMAPQQQAAPTPWSSMPAAPAMAQPAPAQQSGAFFMPFMTPPSPAPAPAAPAAKPAPAPQSLLPFFPVAPQASSAPAPAQAVPVAPAPSPAAQPPANGTPLDPAAFMQMFMKPVEAPK
jgi:hypothetical protein